MVSDDSDILGVHKELIVLTLLCCFFFNTLFALIYLMLGKVTMVSLAFRNLVLKQ